MLEYEKRYKDIRKRESELHKTYESIEKGNLSEKLKVLEGFWKIDQELLELKIEVEKKK